MPEYVAPGVYIEEVSSGIKPIEGVSTSIAGFVGMTERGQLAPQLVTSWLDFQRKYGGIIDPSLSYLPMAVKGFFDNGGQRVYIARVTGEGARDAEMHFPSGGDANLGIKAITVGPGAWGGRVFIRITDPSSPRKAPTPKDPNHADESQFRITVLYYAKDSGDTPQDPCIAGSVDPRNSPVVEDFDNLDSDSDRPNDAISTVNSRSHLIRLVPQKEGMARPDNSPALSGGEGKRGFQQMPPGGDGQPLTAACLIGKVHADVPMGLKALEVVDQVSIICVPDEVRDTFSTGERASLRAEIVGQCHRRRDRFAVLQLTEASTDVEAVKAERISLPDTSRAGVYHPWVRVINPLTRESLVVPPGGHICGIFARSDIERGVHKAPANEVVRGISSADLSNNRRPLSVIYTKGDQDILNPLSVNLIRDFRGDQRGIRLWGSRTLSSDSEWKYVSVRRLFLFVEESIDEGTQWVVFEPNNHQTWVVVRINVTAFLNTVWKSGALSGLTQEQAFFVKCDRTTMTEEDINNGRLICLIGIAPVKPAEFVIFRINQKTIDATG